MFYHSRSKQASSDQLRTLEQMGIRPSEPISSYTANELIQKNHDKWADLPITSWQHDFLLKYGVRLYFGRRGRANQLIEEIKRGRPVEDIIKEMNKEPIEPFTKRT